MLTVPALNVACRKQLVSSFISGDFPGNSSARLAGYQQKLESARGCIKWTPLLIA